MGEETCREQRPRRASGSIRGSRTLPAKTQAAASVRDMCGRQTAQQSGADRDRIRPLVFVHGGAARVAHGREEQQDSLEGSEHLQDLRDHDEVRKAHAQIDQRTSASSELSLAAVFVAVLQFQTLLCEVLEVWRVVRERARQREQSSEHDDGAREKQADGCKKAAEMELDWQHCRHTLSAPDIAQRR
eukprot:3527500-Rhodomonas_salina.2